MCAIIGVVSKKMISGAGWLTIGRDSMKHRGPGGFGEWSSKDCKARFAHRRLSVIDLSTSAGQPMSSPSGDVVVVFNGEIYNFKELRLELRKSGHAFITKSDTEVIIHAWKEWGVDCVDKFNGMFAFAIYDEVQSTTFIARDRMGEKPLYYSFDNGELRFSSELKGLLADESVSRAINNTALNYYLQFGYVPGDMCILEGIHKLPPSNALLFNHMSGEFDVWKYWNIPIFDNSINNKVDENFLVDKFETILGDSVESHLVSDVSTGVLLSGGVDSSLITALAAKQNNNINTYTVSFPNNKSYDESLYAKSISDQFNTNHTEIKIDEIPVEKLPEIAVFYDEPMCDSSMVPTYLLSSVVSDFCKVVLGGDGGDELFGGYKHYNRLIKLDISRKFLPKILAKSAGKISKNFLPTGFKGRQLLASLGIDLDVELPQNEFFFNSKEREKLIPSRYLDLNGGDYSNSSHKGMSVLERGIRSDLTGYLPEDILVKVDRASMASSLEVRSPFLDINVINFALKEVPDYLKTTHNRRKILSKELSKKILPKSFDLKRKQGFSMPLSDLLKKGKWRVFFEEILLDSECIFNKEAVNNLFLGIDFGMNNGERLFSLVIFELWKREYLTC